MSKGILGKKLGMTQIFSATGQAIGYGNRSWTLCGTAEENPQRDGYTAIQVGFGDIRESLVNKPLTGHFQKNHLKPFVIFEN